MAKSTERSIAGTPRHTRQRCGRALGTVWLGIFVACIAAANAPAGLGAEQVPGLVQEEPTSGFYVKTNRGYMVPYSFTIPGTDVAIEMVPIPGGLLRMGSPPTEKGRKANEGPQFEVEIQPFWMAKYETRWCEYQQYMRMYRIFKEMQSRSLRPVTDENRVHAVTAPTELYEPSFTYEKGQDPQQPAVTMTQFAAKQYTKWLSLLTGQQYRLPLECEWEHACRAGTRSAYFFGDDPAQLGDYAWYFDNSDETTHPVGQKKPNPWGLYDIYGNVAEWCIDQVLEDGYQRFAGKRVTQWQAAVWPTQLYPRVLRGGHWDDTAEACRSAARMESNDPEWKSEDPNLPLSPWWFTTDPARGVGFRIVRSLEELPDELISRFWEADVEEIKQDVQARLDEGRGVLGLVDPQLPEVIRHMQQNP
ncbi:MAG: transcriptional regulator [Pirellulaceae bacterium]|nr:MAG: transcriptional regulator [Pirellulaceae bacterium]